MHFSTQAYLAGYGSAAVALLALYAAAAHASAAPDSISQIAHDMVTPSQGDGSIRDEIKCYSLPFGGLGVLSHVLTYWTSLCIGVGVKPIAPIRRRRATGDWGPNWLQHRRWDIVLYVGSMLFTVVCAGLTMRQCARSWPLLLMALWKLLLSFSLNLTGLWRVLYSLRGRGAAAVEGDGPFSRKRGKAGRAAKQLPHQAPPAYEMAPLQEPAPAWNTAYNPYANPGRPSQDGGSSVQKLKSYLSTHKSPVPLLGMLPYAFGTVAGTVGLFAIVHMTFSDSHGVRVLTYVLVVASITLFVSLLFLTGFIGAVLCYCCPHFGAVLGGMAGVGVGFSILLVFLVFYSDLVLAAIEDNWLGAPSGDNTTLQVMYWIYFVAKRLPMISL